MIVHIGIFTPSFETLEFGPYFYKRCNSYLVFPLQTLEFLPYPSLHLNSSFIFIHIGTLTSCIILGFWPSSNWNSYFILSLQTFELSSFSSKHWNSGPIFIQIDLYRLIDLSAPISIKTGIRIQSFH